MDPVLISFLIAGGVIGLGFVGDYLFRKVRIPDILILIFLGFLIGPIFHVVNPDVFSGVVSNLFIALALIMILFNCGLNLNIKRVFEESPKAFTLASLGVFSSVIFVSIFMHYVLNWAWIYGVLLGTVVGGSSSSIIIPLVSRLKIKSSIRTLLSLESAFTDVIVVILGIAFIQLTQSNSISAVYMAARSITAAFSIGAVFGMLIGLIWIKILTYIKWSEYQDILTVGIVLLFYSITVLLGGSGAMFALFFGLVLGNGISLARFFRMGDSVSASTMMKRFQSELTFFVRTFFFVYMGMMFSLRFYNYVLIGIVLSFVLWFGRWISVKIISFKDKLISSNSFLISGMLSRGLAAAVIAQMVYNSKISYYNVFPDVVLTIIMTTVIISAIISSIEK